MNGRCLTCRSMGLPLFAVKLNGFLEQLCERCAGVIADREEYELQQGAKAREELARIHARVSEAADSAWERSRY